MKAEDIQAQRQAGTSLAEIAESKKVSEEKLISTILEAKKAILDNLVADGKLTQAQMDLMVERMQTQVKTMVERTTVGPMQGRQGMGEMRGGMGRSGMGQMQRGMGQGFRGGQGTNQSGQKRRSTGGNAKSTFGRPCVVPGRDFFSS
jgi:hypothetical protein